MAATAYGAPFKNLDFELATVQAPPPGNTPSDAQDAVSAAAALPGQTMPDLIWTPIDPDGNGFSTKWDVTFGGNGVVGGSIASGTYAITLWTKNGASSFSPDETDTFYRLYGDMNGVQNLTSYVPVPSNQKISSDAFGKTSSEAGYWPALDSTADLVIELDDYTLFQQGTSLDFSSFVASI